MSDIHVRQQQVEAALQRITVPPGLTVREWTEADFPIVQRLSTNQGWLTPTKRPAATLIAWRNSWPALVVTEGETVIGFVRGLTDGEITTYVVEILIDPAYRRKGLGRLLLDACHALFPHTRLDLISTETAVAFYVADEFHQYEGEGLWKSYYAPYG